MIQRTLSSYLSAATWRNPRHHARGGGGGGGSGTGTNLLHKDGKLESGSLSPCKESCVEFKDNILLQKYIKHEHTRPFKCILNWAAIRSSQTRSNGNTMLGPNILQPTTMPHHPLVKQKFRAPIQNAPTSNTDYEFNCTGINNLIISLNS
jgi:hypothetical protein